MTQDKPTKETYGNLQKAYDFFNRELFGGVLPDVLITLQRMKGTRGYFCEKRFGRRGGEQVLDELAMNPEHFGELTVEEVLSTLVHEQCHVWQHAFGKPGRGRYHNREWGSKMKEVGLHPSSTGEPGGKETGDKVTHYIVDGGPFREAFGKLKAEGIDVSWGDRPSDEDKPKKRNTRTKYTCPGCGFNAWAKPEAKIVCGECEEEMGAAE
jgi:predicted SprT family Zn-dependent metalloprotease